MKRAGVLPGWREGLARVVRKLKTLTAVSALASLESSAEYKQVVTAQLESSRFYKF
jgi:hypothetical protein